MTTDKPPADGLDNGFARHSRRALAAGAVLVLAAVGAVWALTTGGNDKPAATAAYDSACGLTGGSTATPATGPEVQWQNVDGNWLPVSATQGPGRRSAGEPWSCYAHTPTGAVLAAWGIPAGWTTANFAAGVRQQTVPGAGQAALLKQGPGTTPANQRPTPIGFKLNAYDGQTATITFFMRQRGKNVSCASTVEWAAGPPSDWRLRPASDGSDMSSCQLLPDDLRGIDLIAWGPST
jgi:hypothetical protein